MEYAKFLQDTVEETAKEIQNSQSGEIRKTAEELDEFMNQFSMNHLIPSGILENVWIIATKGISCWEVG